MNKELYKHESGLLFEIGYLYDEENRPYDISAIMLWLPNCTDTPMIIVGWYFGRRDDAATKEYVDQWLADKTQEEIRELNILQDITDEQDRMLQEDLNS